MTLKIERIACAFEYDFSYWDSEEALLKLILEFRMPSMVEKDTVLKYAVQKRKAKLKFANATKGR